MKLAFISDMHLGYKRFEEDAFKQAEYALKDAESKADLIVVAGDIFDSKVPKLEVIKRAAEIFGKVSKPVLMIHGNHERRSKGMTNPVELLSLLTNTIYLHASSRLFETNGEKVFIVGMGSVPEDLAKTALNKVLSSLTIPKDVFKVLIIHQSIKELVYEEECLELNDLKSLPFDLIVNGHIHDPSSQLDGRLIMPGSTVITQLKKEETGKRKYVIYDTSSKTYEWQEIEGREFLYKELLFNNASFSEIKERINEEVKKKGNAILKLVLKGSLKEGLRASDFVIPHYPDVFIQNELEGLGLQEVAMKLREEFEEKSSVREVGIKLLKKNLAGKTTIIKNPEKLFELLVENVEMAEEYLRKEGGLDA